ncbi:MAG: translesion DNA synthesis-associated protein ImuA [Pseudomonadota bacterium]
MVSPRLAEASSSLQLPHVWHGGEVGCQEEVAWASGHAALDAQLPGRGWPGGGLVELLQERPEEHAWRLLLPALAQAVLRHAGPVVLIDPPREPFGPSLRAQGLPAERLLWVHAGKPAARLWATEQALRCAEVSAVLAWLPQARNAELRRLHLASQQQGRLFFAFRPLSARNDSSPARLRLLLEGQEAMKVHVLKRRGPPLASPILLAAQEGRLAELLRARKGRPVGMPLPEQVLSSSPAPSSASPALKPLPVRSLHALDRTAVPG